MELKSRGIVLAVVLVLGVLFIAPTFAPQFFGPQYISKPIALGLDLKGGVHLLYQVKTEEAVRSKLQLIAQNIRTELRNKKIAVSRAVAPDPSSLEITLLTDRGVEDAKQRISELYGGQIQFAHQESSEGGRVKLIYSMGEAVAQRIARESVSQAIETLDRRVNQFGVAEPLIQRVGLDRILLQMPGVKDIEAVKRVVGSVAKLEFRLIPPAGGGEGRVKLKDRAGALVDVEDQVLMTGDAVAKAKTELRPGHIGVSISFTQEGTTTFRRITQENVGRQLAIILDGVVYSDPVIREAITQGEASITGRFTDKEASELAMVLRAGALPAPLEVLEERTVGPTLGSASIRAGISATAIGFAFILIFMVLYYAKAGLLAMASILLNLFLLLAVLSAFGATLTLPGLAGLALTAGMAVDSNVIIFERIREELRNGAGRDAAVAAGFHNAWSAILDSNVTTLLAGIVLYVLGSGPIKGFAVTLSIGIFTTIFCAMFVSRLGFDLFVLKGRRGLSI